MQGYLEVQMTVDEGKEESVASDALSTRPQQPALLTVAQPIKCRLNAGSPLLIS